MTEEEVRKQLLNTFEHCKRKGEVAYAVSISQKIKIACIYKVYVSNKWKAISYPRNSSYVHYSKFPNFSSEYGRITVRIPQILPLFFRISKIILKDLVSQLTMMKNLL